MSLQILISCYETPTLNNMQTDIVIIVLLKQPRSLKGRK